MDRKKWQWYIELMLKKIKEVIAKIVMRGGKKKENWAVKQFKEMGKLRGKLILM